MKITADTITDEQIRKLRDSSNSSNDDIRACAARALNAGRMWADHEIRKARARCAEILNAKEGE